MDLLPINMAVNSLMQSVTALNNFYTSLYTDIQHKPDRWVLENADELTGNRLARSSIESFLEENRQYLGNSYQGLAIVQTAQQQSSRIYEKLEEMEALAENAAEDRYTEEELEAAREEYETLMDEIDQIALGTRPGGFFMLSFTAFGAVGVTTDRDTKIEIDSMDMTVTGLGLLDSMNLSDDPEETFSAVQMAIDEVDAYREHLEESRTDLESSLDDLNEEREALQPALAAVDESVSAWQALQAITNMTSDTAASLLAIQANVESDKAIQLLLKELD